MLGSIFGLFLPLLKFLLLLGVCLLLLVELILEFLLPLDVLLNFLFGLLVLCRGIGESTILLGFVCGLFFLFLVLVKLLIIGNDFVFLLLIFILEVLDLLSSIVSSLLGVLRSLLLRLRVIIDSVLFDTVVV